MLTALSDGDKRKIYHAALRVLAHTGMTLQHDDAVELLKDAGCQQAADGRSHHSRRALVEKAIASAPANIPLFDREGRQVMDLGGRRAYFGTGSDLMAHVDGKTLARSITSLESVKRAARLCDALPNIDFIMSFAIPHEIDPRRAFVESFAAMAANSIKPIVNIADSRTESGDHLGNDQGAARRRRPLRENPTGCICPVRSARSSIRSRASTS
jgi:trimethylamine--corrinoid protein Co-methyltransferase